MRIYGSVVSLVLLVGCAHHAERCGPTTIDLDGPDDCTAAGGVCGGDCPYETHHTSSEHCPGFLFASSCCMRGRDPSYSSSSGSTSSSGSFSPPFGGGKCNDIQCAPGCVCRAIEATSGHCGAICDCANDAGSGDASANDASANDASDAASDASDDASDAGDATDFDAAPEQSVKCGVIGCSSRCSCQSQSLSTCTCYSNDCH